MIELRQTEGQGTLFDALLPASYDESSPQDRLTNCLQGIAALGLLWAAFATLLIGIIAIQTQSHNNNRGFAEYWASGQLFVHGSDPYDPDATLDIERSIGLANPVTAISLRPPTLFVLTCPIGFFSAPVAAAIWTASLVIALLLSLHTIWVSLDRPHGRLYLLGLCFAPILTCLMAGQIGIFLLLGVALFFRFQQTNPLLAGMALLPCTCKPHLFVPFAIALLLWTAHRKQYRVLVGFFLALFAVVAITSWIDRHVWSQWLHWMHTYRAVNSFQPDLSKMFRLLIRPDAIWLQFVPEIVASAWAAWYFWARRAGWDWMQQGMLLLIISVGCAPYSGFTDESILLVPLLAGAYRAHASGRTLLPCALILAVAVTELFKGNWIGTTYYLWTIPAYLLWYIYATRQSRELAPTPQLTEARA